jgi:hypothetical protein
LDGTYASGGNDGDPGIGSALAPPPQPGPVPGDASTATITFRRDGSFATRNMPSPEPDPVTGAIASERGAGRYALSGNALDLTYTDGLARRKEGKRSYVVVPIDGPDSAPTQIAIQGRIFKLEATR